MGKILVAEKRLNLGVREPGEKSCSGETRSSGTGGSHPGQESWSVFGGEAHIPQSLGTKGNQEGWPSWVEYRSGGTRGPHPGVDIFPRPVSKGYALLWLSLTMAKPYCGCEWTEALREMTGKGQCTEKRRSTWWACDNMNGTFAECRNYTMLSYSGLAKGEGYIVIEQLVTVHCSFLYFGLVSTVT